MRISDWSSDVCSSDLANIDYGTSEAQTTYGIIGIKVWVYKGDMLPNGEMPPETAAPRDEERRTRRAPRGARPDGRRHSAGSGREIGRAACRERVRQYVTIPVVDGT